MKTNEKPRVPSISNDLAPTDPGYGSSWIVTDFLGGDTVFFQGTYAECESYLGAS